MIGIMRNGKRILPAAFYIGDEYQYFNLRELEAASQSVRCVRNSELEKEFASGNFDEAEYIKNRTIEIVEYLSEKTYKRNERILGYFSDETLLYSLYGFENYISEEPEKLHVDVYNSGYIDNESYIVSTKRKKYKDLNYDFNIGQRYFFIFKKEGNSWKIEDILSTQRGNVSDSYTYIGDIQYDELRFPFLKTIFKISELWGK